MKVLNSILIICAILLFFIGIKTPASFKEVETPTTKYTILDIQKIDPRPNIEKVIDDLYPM
ncbi:MAG: hypothetical protein K2G70_01420 [Turicibacter sp.]|nr:hypothetical protein [Turicibacter sp.]